MYRKKSSFKLLGMFVLVMLLTLAIVGCGAVNTVEDQNTGQQGSDQDSTDQQGQSHNNESDYPEKPISFIVPFGPGGGMDTTARVTSEVLATEGLVSVPTPVENRDGGGGNVGMSYLVQYRDEDPYTILFHSPGILLNELSGSTEIGYESVTPIARLLSDSNIFSVRNDSELESISEVMDMLKDDLKSVVVGGTSGPGGNDHLAFMMAAKEAGVDIKNVEYISFEGSGELVSALLNGTIQIMSAGVNDVMGQLEAGNFKALAVAGEERYELDLLADVPTLKEEGIDVSFPTWRGVFGPPNMPEEAITFLEQTLEEMVATESWGKKLEEYNWTNAFMDSETFETFLSEQYQIVGQTFQEMGLSD